MSLFSTVADFLKPAPPLEGPVQAALARVGELVDPLLHLTHDFEKKLTEPARFALGYCAGLVDALPGPVNIGHRAFADDPLVHALFATADDIDQMLGRSQAVRDFLASPASWEGDDFYAMLVARRQQKRQLGMEQQGEVIRSDVPQTVLYFSGQTLVEPGSELDATRLALRRLAFDSLLHTFHAHVDALRHEREGLRADLSVERAHLTVLRGHTGGQEIAVRTRHLAELDQRLRDRAEALMPHHLIEELAAYLRAPEPALHLTPVSVTIDRLGIVREEIPDDPNTRTLNFPELTARDRRLHLAMIARINRAEAQAAVDRVKDQQHRFMVL